jgi:hypothetical protein
MPTSLHVLTSTEILGLRSALLDLISFKSDLVN